MRIQSDNFIFYLLFKIFRYLSLLTKHFNIYSTLLIMWKFFKHFLFYFTKFHNIFNLFFNYFRLPLNLNFLMNYFLHIYSFIRKIFIQFSDFHSMLNFKMIQVKHFCEEFGCSSVWTYKISSFNNLEFE